MSNRRQFFFAILEQRAKKSKQLLDDFLLQTVIAKNSAYVVRQSVPKSHHFLTEVVPNLDEKRFKILTRMSWENFNKVLGMIKDDLVFNGPNSWKQFPVHKQLMIVLYRLGSSGEGNTLFKISALFGVSDGGAIDKITRRVFIAILRLKDTYLNWPSVTERATICKETFNELPNCIGYIDGTEVKLAEKPFYDAESYFSRKHIYSLKVQAVCDFRKKIRHIVTGYPGSVHDARIYSSCDLSSKSFNFFSGNQWIAGDSAYKLSSTLITPYRATSKIGTLYERNLFNYTFGKYRIRIENTFGMLKERFGSLKEIKIRIGTDTSLNLANAWIIVCCILHNIVDDADLDYEFDSEILTEPEEETSELCFNGEAESKRQAIIQFIKNQSD